MKCAVCGEKIDKSEALHCSVCGIDICPRCAERAGFCLHDNGEYVYYN